MICQINFVRPCCNESWEGGVNQGSELASNGCRIGSKERSDWQFGELGELTTLGF